MPLVFRQPVGTLGHRQVLGEAIESVVEILVPAADAAPRAAFPPEFIERRRRHHIRVTTVVRRRSTPEVPSRDNLICVSDYGGDQ